MNDDCCLSLIIKQISCENGYRRIENNGAANINEDTKITLEHGYSVTVSANNNDSLDVTISNPVYIPDITFKIPKDSYKIIDLPLMNGTYTLYLGVKQTCCCNI